MEDKFDPTARPIEEELRDLAKDIPPEEWQKGEDDGHRQGK